MVYHPHTPDAVVKDSGILEILGFCYMPPQFGLSGGKTLEGMGQNPSKGYMCLMWVIHQESSAIYWHRRA